MQRRPGPPRPRGPGPDGRGRGHRRGSGRRLAAAAALHDAGIDPARAGGQGRAGPHQRHRRHARHAVPRLHRHRAAAPDRRGGRSHVRRSPARHRPGLTCPSWRPCVPIPGQAASAANLLRVLAGSGVVASHQLDDTRVQDAYSLRCAPQVIGAGRDTLDHARIGHRPGAGQRHRQPGRPPRRPGGVLRQLPRSPARIRGRLPRHRPRRPGRRSPSGGSTASSTRPVLMDLPAFLAADPGVDSGLMLAQYSAAALVADCRRLAVPASVDSIPTSAMQEDHVSMGWAAARKLRRAVDNVTRVVAIEVMTAARAVELRQPHAAGAGHRRGRRGPAPDGSRDRRRPLPGPGDRPHHRPGAIRSDRGLGRVGHRPAPVGSTPAPGDAMNTSSSNQVAAPSREMGTSRASSSRRAITAARGSALHCRAWPQEAAWRMLHNNLDPAVAERPEELVVYGGSGKAARDWASFDAISATLQRLGDDETLLVQSGRPVGVLRTHEWAPRVLIANSNLVGEWDNWDEFRRLEHLGLTMYGQMTAGSWIYIGIAGHPAGHLRDLRGGRRQTLRRLAGGHADPHRRSRWHGRRPAARGHHERRSGHLRGRRPHPAPTPARNPLPGRRSPPTSTTAIRAGPASPGRSHGPVHRRRSQRGRAARRPSSSARSRSTS